MEESTVKVADAAMKSAPSLANHTPPSSFDLLANVGMSFFFVIFLILILAWLIKRTGFKGVNRGLIHLRDSYALSNKERIILVEVDSQLLVIGVTAQQMTLLHTVDKESTQLLLSNAMQDVKSEKNYTFQQILKASFKRNK